MGNKVRLITPFLMLSAGAIASIIMYINEYEFERMLWILLIVLLVFYVIGDTVRYLYASIRPRIIPEENISTVVMGRFNEEDNGNVVTVATEESDSEEYGEDDGGEYSDEALAEYEEDQAEGEATDGGYESEEYEEAYTDGN
ncbi:MAG: hypothetical protein NC337_05640 [Roseburia sp.]|nr:hypothetical protein [Roseburia sp.]